MPCLPPTHTPSSTCSTGHGPSSRARTLLSPFGAAATLLLTGVVALGCYGSDAPAPEAAQPQDGAPQATASQNPSAATGGGAGDLAPVTSRSGQDPAAGTSEATGEEVSAPGIVFRLPEAWEQQEPSSSMRLAQAVIPGETGNGELTVFYFGPGGGGGVQANIDRWVGQVELDPAKAPEQGNFTVGAYQVTWIHVRGTLKPSTMGLGPTEAKPGSALLGAVIEGNSGPWFVKTTGPEATLDAARDDFFSMVRSSRIP